MRMIKKMALVFSVLAITGCTSTEREVGNKAELSNNYFLSDKYHLVETITAQEFIDKVKDQKSPTKKDDDGKTVNKTALERKDIFIFNAGTRQSSDTDRTDILAYLANSIARKDMKFTLENDYRIYRVDMSAEVTAYSASMGTEEALTANGERYEDILTAFGVEPGNVDKDKKFDKRFCVGQKFENVDDLTDLNPVDENNDGYVDGADKICNGYVAVFNEGVIQPGGYLFNDKMLEKTDRLYHYDRSNQLKTLYSEYNFKDSKYKDYSETTIKELKEGTADFVDKLFKPALTELLNILK